MKLVQDTKLLLSKQGIKQLLITIMLIETLIFAAGTSAEELALSQLPLSVKDAASPNLAFTFDDSGSMAKGYLPDDIDAFAKSRAAKSVYFNKLTYNPGMTYQPGVDANGVQLPQADFAKAVLAISSNLNNKLVIDIYRAIADELDLSNYAVDLAKNYRHPWDLLSDSPELYFAEETGDGELLGENTGQPAYYYTWNESLSGCDKDRFNDNCYEKHLVSENEKQNFSNWYQYHSLRLTFGKTAVSMAFNNLPSSVRVARQTLNQQGLKSGDENRFIAEFSAANNEKRAFYHWLFSIHPSGSTPLRSALITAGEFFSRSGANNAYEKTPGSNEDGNDEIVSCRRNYHLMFTDGLYSAEASIKLWAIGDFDQQALSVNDWPGPSEFAYDPGDPAMAIYGGPGASTLADIAFYYWARDLQQGEEFKNNISPVIKSSFSDLDGLSKQEYWDPENDPSTWQNMVNFIIGLGINGKYDVSNQQDYQALLSGAADWLSPTPVDSSDSNNLNARVDDLWHAAIASRGQYYSAAKTADFEQALNDIINQFSLAESSVAPVSVNSSSLVSGMALYQAGFESNNWTGTLKKFLLSDGSVNDANSNECNAKPAGTPCETEIEVNNASVASWHQRKVFSYNPESVVTSKGIKLTGGASLRWSQLSAQQKADLRVAESETTAQQRLDYVLGDKALEQAEKNGGDFRNRNDEQRTLGAIIHGGPLLVSNGKNADGSFVRFYPDFITPSGKSYADFLMTIRDRPAMIYAGAADGQLHGYRAEDLNELFSFIPDAVFPYLDDYSDKNFGFWPFVDGPQKSADVFSNNSWKTILVGSYRSSAKGLYALDITSPNQFSETDVMWEYSERRFPNDKDLGHVYGESSIVRTARGASTDDLSTGDWLVAFGNGYNSVNGRAVLYFLDPETGEIVKKMDTGVGPDSGVDEAGNEIKHAFNVVADMPNGLAAPTVIDLEGDFKADFAYAGDLYGNLWRFDLRDRDVENWSVELVYAAKDKASVPQAITGIPVVGRHPDGNPGLMVYFGTGKYLEQADNDVSNAGVQSFYGIWDRVDLNLLFDADGDGTASNDNYHLANGFKRKHLLQQKILEQVVFDGNENVQIRTLSRNRLRYFPGTGLPGAGEGYLGWFLDFDTEQGERVTTQAVLRGSHIIVLTQTPFVDLCESGGGSWLMELNARTGGVPIAQPLDNNGDGLINSKDYHQGAYTAGWKKLGLGSYTIPAIIYDRKTRLEHKIISTGSGKLSSLTERVPLTDTGRQAWRQLR